MFGHQAILRGSEGDRAHRPGALIGAKRGVHGVHAAAPVGKGQVVGKGVGCSHRSSLMMHEKGRAGEPARPVALGGEGQLRPLSLSQPLAMSS